MATATRAIGDDRAAGHQHGKRAPQLGLASKPSIITTGRAPPARRTTSAQQTQIEQQVEGLLDLGLGRGVGADVTELDAYRKEVGGGQLGSERPGEDGFARSGVSQHDDRLVGRGRTGQRGPEEIRNIRFGQSVVPPALRGRKVARAGDGDESGRRDITLAQRRHDEIARCVLAAEDRLFQARVVALGQAGADAVEGGRGELQLLDRFVHHHAGGLTAEFPHRTTWSRKAKKSVEPRLATVTAPAATPARCPNHATSGESPSRSSTASANDSPQDLTSGP
jgi:hypothetical protein